MKNRLACPGSAMIESSTTLEKANQVEVISGNFRGPQGESWRCFGEAARLVEGVRIIRNISEITGQSERQDRRARGPNSYFRM